MDNENIKEGHYTTDSIPGFLNHDNNQTNRLNFGALWSLF